MTNVQDIVVKFPEVMVEIVRICERPAINTVLLTVHDALRKISERAIAINDAEIQEQLARIGYLEDKLSA